MSRTFCFLGAVVGLCGVAAAQMDLLPKPKEKQTVYVRDSATATEKLALAERMERLKEWERSADVYQEIVMKLADRVIATHNDDDGLPTQYESVAVLVQERLSRWPAEGLAVYRRRFEDTARDLLNSSPEDSATWRRVMAQYFCTDAARDAGLRLINDGIERGEFSSAAAIGNRLLKLHPALVAERPMVLFQTALAENLGADAVSAKTLLQELKTRFPNANGSIRGADVNLAATLEAELQSQSALPTTYASDDWPSPFGTPEAAAVPATISAGGAKLFSVELSIASARNRSQKLYQQRTKSDLDIGNMTGVVPAIESGALFFQDNVRVYAIDLASGLPLPGWAATYPADRHNAFTIEGYPSAPGNPLTVSLRRGRVVALLGQSASAVTSDFQENNPPQIVCLDRETGKLNWAAIMAKLALPQDLAKLHDYNFYGTPVVTDDSVYVLVHSARNSNFEECYLLSLKLADGSLQWASYVSSTSNGAAFLDFNQTGQNPTASTAQVTFAQGRLYVLTNQGSCACIDADDGKTLWLNVYQRSLDALRGAERGYMQQPTITRPFTINPPIVTRGRVFVLPNDANDLFVYDCSSGDTLSSVPRKVDRNSAQADMLLAVVDDRLVLANLSMLYVVPWSNFDREKSLLDNNGMFRSFNGGDASNKVAILGRPFVSEKYVLIPTTDKLYRMTLDQFKFESVYPADGKWDDDESPGNIIATSDNVVIAGPTRVTAYADLAAATAKLDTRIQQNPDDVEAYLHYGELYLAAAKPAPAIQWLDQAIAHMGGAANLRSGPQRDRLFEIIANGVAKQQRAGVPAPELMTSFFDRAKIVASTPRQQVRYRLAQAAYYRAAGNVAGELELEQQVLADSALRSTPAADKNGATTAGAIAEQSVNELIQQHGVQIYAAYETAAFEQFGALRQADPIDAEKLLAIADEFPASTQTPEILSTASARFEALQQPRRATQTLRRLLKLGTTGTQKAAVLESLARNYLAVPNQLEIALVRLRQARDVAPQATLKQPLKLADGRTIADQTLTQALDQLDSFRSSAIKAALPQLGVPLTKDDALDTPAAFRAPVELGAVASIIRQQTNVTRNDRVVTLSTDRNRIGVFDTITAKPLWPEVDFGEAPVGCAYSGDVLVVVGSSRVIGFSKDGKVLWQVALSDLPAAEVPAASTNIVLESNSENDGGFSNGRNRKRIMRMGRFIRQNNRDTIPIPDNSTEDVSKSEQIDNFVLLSDRLLVGTTSGRVLSLDLGAGGVTWQARMQEQSMRHFIANDDFLAVSYIDPAGTSEIYVLDAITGRTTLHETYDPTNGGNQMTTAVNLAMSPDGVLITVLANRLLGRDLYDLSAPQWSSPISQNNPMEAPFGLSNQDNQLVISGKYVLALARPSLNASLQEVRPFDLRTLQPLKFHNEPPAGDRDAIYPAHVPANSDGANVAITAVGSAFYVAGPRSLAANNIERQDNGWFIQPGGVLDHGLTRSFFVTQDYAIQVNQLANPDVTRAVVPAIELELYDRSLTDKGVESGRTEYRAPLSDAAGFMAEQWQVVDGAFFYVSGDQKLKMIRANR